MSELWAAAALAGTVALALAVARPRTTSRAPRLGATVELLTLASIGLMPPLLLACGAAAWGTASGSAGYMIGDVCLLANSPIGLAQVALYSVALVLVARIAVLSVRAVRASRRVELRWLPLDRASPRPLPGGETVWVVPSKRLFAYSGGLRRPRAVATTGLLDLLEPVEQEAVLRHEVAHLRLGHPRILVIGASIADAYCWLPPARMAWARLRRELEAAADDEVVAAIGSEPLLRALAKVTLAQAPEAAAAFADPDDLRYRIRRLQQSRPPRARASLALGLAGALLLAVLTSATCVALHAGVAWSSLGPCVIAFGFLGWRPTWTRDLRVRTGTTHGA